MSQRVRERARTNRPAGVTTPTTQIATASDNHNLCRQTAAQSDQLASDILDFTMSQAYQLGLSAEQLEFFHKNGYAI